MDLSTALSQINYLAVLVSTLAGFFIGGLWYSPFMFGGAWQRELDVSDQDLSDRSMPLVFGTTFILLAVISFFMALFLGPGTDFYFGLGAGFLTGTAWVATAMGINALFEGKSLKLWAIDAGYMVVVFVFIGGILGAWK